MIGNKIKERREMLGLTQEELGKMLGIGKTAVSNYEQNLSAPKVSILIQLFSVLKCDANYLFEEYIVNDDFYLTDYEKKHIKKYRILDFYGKKAIDGLLETEHLRCAEHNIAEKNSNNSEQPKSSIALKAARSFDNKPIETIEVDENRLKNAPIKKL